MATGIREQDSGLVKTDRGQRRSRLRVGLGFAACMIGHLTSVPASPCFGSPSPGPTSGAEQSTAKGEIAFELYNENLIIVKATVGPIKNVNMIIDTGTSPSAIGKDTANRLKLRGVTESLETLNGTIQTQTAIVPRVQIGPLYADNIRVVEQDLSSLERSLGISLGGIAGLDILSRGSFTIDYARKKITFGSIAKNEKTVPFETRLPCLTVKVKIEGQEVRLLVDSGTWGLLVYRNRLQAARDRVRPDPKASISSPGGMTRISWFRGEVSLGEDNLGQRNVAIADVDSDPHDEFDGLLGFAKMGFQRVSFDFKNGLFGWD